MLNMLGHSRTNSSYNSATGNDNVLISYSSQQLVELARKARQENRKMGKMWTTNNSNHQLLLSAIIADSDADKAANWSPKWLVLYQNLLFIYASEREANGLLPLGSAKDKGSCTPSSRPLSIWLLEGCTCEKLLTLASNSSNPEATPQTPQVPTQHSQYWQHAFVVMYPGLNGLNNEIVLVLAANGDDDCESWMAAIRDTQYWQLYNEYQVFKERYAMAAHVLETERIAKWNYVVQLDEAHEEIKRLRWALSEARCEAHRTGSGNNTSDDSAPLSPQNEPNSPTSPDRNGALGAADEQLRKIKKAQSLMRGWLCRHRWKAIVDEYVKSPYAEKMKVRNKIIFRIVKDEREYVDNLNVLVSSFLRPLRMAASSSCGGGSSTSTCAGKACQHQPHQQFVISHEEVNAVFLNCQTLLFLHQIFLQGLSSALDRWPQLLIGDIFQLLLPALSVYTEYVRNHYVSVQTLAELKMNRPPLAAMIRQMELKQESGGDNRSLEVLLTYPMNHIPRYILNLHELLAYTMHNHIDRPKLEAALAQLEDLSLQMSTEMSESEHIRKNLSIERMIGEGGDVLLDPDEVLVRQGALLEFENVSTSTTLSGSTTSLAQTVGATHFSSIVQALLASSSSSSSVSSGFLTEVKAATAAAVGPNNDKAVPRTVFLFSHYLIVTSRASNGKLSLVKYHGIIPLSECLLLENRAGSAMEAATTSIASFPSSSSIFSAMSTSSSGSMNSLPQSQQHDNEFSIIVDYKANGTCVVITFVASNWREKQLWCSDIMQCLEKIRFDEIVLETRRYFNDTPTVANNENQSSVTVQQTTNAIVNAAKNAKKGKGKEVKAVPGGEMIISNSSSSAKSRPIIKQASVDTLLRCLTDFRLQTGDFINVFLSTYRLFTSGDVVLNELVDAYRHWKHIGEAVLEEQEAIVANGRSSATSNPVTPGPTPNRRNHLYQKTSPRLLQKTSPVASRVMFSMSPQPTGRHSTPARTCPCDEPSNDVPTTTTSLPTTGQPLRQIRERLNTGDGDSNSREFDYFDDIDDDGNDDSSLADGESRSSRRRIASSTSASSGNLVGPGFGTPLLSSLFSPNLSGRPLCETVPESDIADDVIVESNAGGRSTVKQVNPGMVVFSVANQRRRISSALATQAFARATAGALDLEVGRLQKEHEKQLKADQLLHSAQCLNIFNIIRHWSIVYPEDFVVSNNPPSTSIGQGICQLLSEMACDNISFTQQEGAAICKLLRQLTSGKAVEGKRKGAPVSAAASDANRVWLFAKLIAFQKEQPDGSSDLNASSASLMAPPSSSICKAAFSASTVFDVLPAIDIAEQMTYIDFTLFKSIKMSELMNQAWSKSATKERDAPTVTTITSHFNHMSLVVVTNVVSQASSQDRANTIKKWLLIASTCYAMHNYNGALQVVSALQSSPIYRLKKTWEKVSKQTRHCFDKLTAQLSAENRFKHLREELHQIDPPCVPYLGMYLQDLTLIDEGCPTFVSNYLVNFSKMKMIYQVISEIQSYQSVVYKIAVKQQVIDQLLDRSLTLDDDTVYRLSLTVEPRQPQAQR